MKNISSLNVDEAVVFDGADWKKPVVTDYGLEIVREDIPPQRKDAYKKNYDELKQRLEKQLDGYRNVFTHNPWGEYGHEEHVQVYRVIRGLQEKMGFTLWYSNYVGEKSFKLMSRHLDQRHFEYIVFETNKALALDIKQIYKKNKCWTWRADWEWFKKESFIREVLTEGKNMRGRPFPTNFLEGIPSSHHQTMKQKLVGLTKQTLRNFGISITRPRFRKVVSLKPEQGSRGDVLLSWLVDPFLLKPGESMPNSHTQYWDCSQIAKTFLELGYSVDVIDSRNATFIPKKQYSYFIGHRINYERIAGLLGGGCIKIAHLDTAHWVFNNYSTYLRKLELQQRKGITIKESHRLIELNLAIEEADYAVTYGNRFAFDTYRYANKPLFRVPMSTCAVFPWQEHKDYDACRSNFVWFGSGGFVHKGLDVVLEAFADMSESHLYVCGPLQKEKDFIKGYYTELYQTPNIHAVGWVDVEGPEFREIVSKCIGLVYASCSESGGGSVVTCMHAGLIPLVSYESSVDVDDFGIIFKDNSVNTIKNTVHMVSNLPSDQLRQMARKAWECARANYTRDKFTEEYKRVVLTIMGKAENQKSEALLSAKT